ncbi:hypothetical protein DM860_005701 [Cuscuta australis]|uniref:Uncharacterized protein n=1 Tax=Cuscuta australis TaxID=267555 RepID=A0A328DRF8_9ASTE|nr:hypothetical protein DM860_005701 [Cuscuta australis]
MFLGCTRDFNNFFIPSFIISRRFARYAVNSAAKEIEAAEDVDPDSRSGSKHLLQRTINLEDLVAKDVDPDLFCSYFTAEDAPSLCRA